MTKTIEKERYILHIIVPERTPAEQEEAEARMRQAVIELMKRRNET